MIMGFVIFTVNPLKIKLCANDSKPLGCHLFFTAIDQENYQILELKAPATSVNNFSYMVLFQPVWFVMLK